MKRFLKLGAAVLLVAIALVGCNAGLEGEAELTFGISPQARGALTPPGYTDDLIFSGTVTGATAGVVWSGNILEGEQVTVAMPADQYTIAIDGARSTDSLVVAHGETVVDLAIGDQQTIVITVAEFSGPGTLDLTMSWTSGVMGDPRIESTLSYGADPAVTAEWLLGIDQATYFNDTLAAGWYIVNALVYDNVAPNPSAGLAQLIRIQQGQTTTGVYDLSAIATTGQLWFDITVDAFEMATLISDPLPEGYVSVPAGGTWTNVTESTGALMTWYLFIDGVLTVTEPNAAALNYEVPYLRVHNSSAKRPYVANVIAVSSDGKLAGQLDWYVNYP